MAFAGIAIEPVAKRPDAGDGAEQGRFAGAGRAGDQGAFVAAKAEAVGRDQRRSVGQLDQKLPQIDGGAAGRWLDVDRVGAGRKRRGAGDRRLEAVETRDHRTPFGERAVEEMKNDSASCTLLKAFAVCIMPPSWILSAK